VGGKLYEILAKTIILVGDHFSGKALYLELIDGRAEVCAWQKSKYELLSKKTFTLVVFFKIAQKWSEISKLCSECRNREDPFSRSD